jgi:hypothetical protein
MGAAARLPTRSAEEALLALRLEALRELPRLRHRLRVGHRSPAPFVIQLVDRAVPKSPIDEEPHHAPSLHVPLRRGLELLGQPDCRTATVRARRALQDTRSLERFPTFETDKRIRGSARGIEAAHPSIVVRRAVNSTETGSISTNRVRLGAFRIVDKEPGSVFHLAAPPPPLRRRARAQ